MSVMGVALLSVVAMMSGAQEGATTKRWVLYHGQPGAIAVTLSAERSTYYVGEPVRLTVAVRNESDEALAGFFNATSGNAEVSYRRSGLPFIRFDSKSKATSRRQWRDELRAPAPLEPGEELKSDLKLAMHGDGRIVLEEAGEYEFKVISRPAPKDADYAVESNVVVVRVDPVPDAQREAFAEYSRHGLGAVVQSAGSVAEKNPATLLAAADFVDRFPFSPYAREVRKELVRALRVRVLQNRASKEQLELYETLREAEPPGQ